jgi:hypothetical protein
MTDVKPFGIADDGVMYNAESPAVKAYMAVAEIENVDVSIGSCVTIHNTILAKRHVNLSEKYKGVEEIIVNNVADKMQEIRDEKFLAEEAEKEV